MAVIPIAARVILSLGLVVIPFTAACTSYIETTGKKGDEGLWRGSKLGTTKTGCKDACTADALCVAADIDGSNDCHLFHEIPSLTDVPAVTFFECDPCSMSRTPDKRGGVTTVQLSLTSAEQCRSGCLYITQCRGVRYSGGACSIYGGTPDASNTGDVLSYYKHSCTTGKDCCMSANSTLKADVAPMLTLTSTIESCEAVCLQLKDCVSVYFLNNVCYVYTEGTTLTDVSGSTHSLKTCTGVQKVTDTVNRKCIGASGTRPLHNIYLGFLMVLFTLHV